MSKLTLNEVQYERHWDILEDENFEEVTEEKIVDKRRWVCSVEQVVKHIPTGRFFEIGWEVANSESSEGSEAEGYWWTEVVPKEVVTTVYVPLKGKE
jgi:hypothetical protein